MLQNCCSYCNPGGGGGNINAGNFDCIVGVIVAFVCLLRDLCSLHDLPWGALSWNNYCGSVALVEWKSQKVVFCWTNCGASVPIRANSIYQHIWDTPKKSVAKKSMLNFSRWTRTFVPCEKWDSPKVQKMTHNAKFDPQGGGQYGRPQVQTC